MSDTAELGSTTSTDVKDTAKTQAQSLAATSKDEATNVVETAKEQVQAVTSDLRDQTRQLTDEARSQLNDHAFAQRDNAVGSLRSIGDELTGMAEKADVPGLGAQLTREVGGWAHKSADFLQEREPGQLVDELRGLARRRPGYFLLGAAFAGLVVGRVTRGAKTAHSASPEPGSAHQGIASSTPVEPAVGYAAVPVGEPAGAPDVWGPESPAYPSPALVDGQPGGIR